MKETFQKQQAQLKKSINNFFKTRNNTHNGFKYKQNNHSPSLNYSLQLTRLMHNHMALFKKSCNKSQIKQKIQRAQAVMAYTVQRA